MGKAILITSGKGGVGKTTLTAEIGQALALLGQRVCVVDFDMGLRNLDIALGNQEGIVYDMGDILNKRVSVKNALVKIEENLFLLAASQSASFSQFPVSLVQSVILNLKVKYDYVLIDSPAGFSDGFVYGASSADRAIIVATPDNTSLRDSQRASEELFKQNVKNVRLIVNRVNKKLIKNGIFANIDEIIDTVGARLIGIVPEDISLSSAINQGLSKVKSKKKSMTATAILDIADRIMEKEVPLKRFW